MEKQVWDVELELKKGSDETVGKKTEFSWSIDICI